MILDKPKRIKSARVNILTGRYWSTAWQDALKALVSINAESWNATESEITVHEIKESVKTDLKPHVKPHDSGNDAKSIVQEKIDSYDPKIAEEKRARAVEYKRRELAILDKLRNEIQQEMVELQGDKDNPLIKRQREFDELRAKRHQKEAAAL